jgi:hypothetical protein
MEECSPAQGLASSCVSRPGAPEAQRIVQREVARADPSREIDTSPDRARLAPAVDRIDERHEDSTRAIGVAARLELLGLFDLLQDVACQTRHESSVARRLVG